MKRLIVCMAIFSNLSAISAAELPAIGTTDGRMRNVTYNPDQVVQLVGVRRNVLQVQFAPTERIAHVALGDTVAWEVAANGSILFLKPREPNGLTNMIVTTTRENGQSRNYAFELSIRPEVATSTMTTSTSTVATDAQNATTYMPDAFYRVRFTYPQDEAARRVEVQQQRTAETSRTRARNRLSTMNMEGASRNWAYTATGAQELEPAEISDNGQQTWLRFPGNTEIPAIFIVTADGDESRIPFHISAEYVVLHGTARALRLRRGQQVLCIFNQQYDAIGANTGTGTVSPDVVRTLR